MKYRLIMLLSQFKALGDILLILRERRQLLVIGKWNSFCPAMRLMGVLRVEPLRCSLSVKAIFVEVRLVLDFKSRQRLHYCRAFVEGYNFFCLHECGTHHQETKDRKSVSFHVNMELKWIRVVRVSMYQLVSGIQEAIRGASGRNGGMRTIQ